MAKETEKAPKLKGVKVITPTFRASFPQLHEPKAFKKDGEETGKPKYSITMLWPEKKAKEMLKEIRVAIKKARIEMFGEDEPDNFENPLLSGDDMEDLQGYAGMKVLRAASLNPPGVIDRDKSEILDIKNKIYGGCYCRASVVFKAWEMGKEGKRGHRTGVTCYLQNVQFVEKGERFGGGSNAEDDFDVIETDDDDDTASDDDDDFGDMGF